MVFLHRICECIYVPDQALEHACGVVTAHLYEFATDRNASHVARCLLCVAAGRNVLPAAGRAAGGIDGASHGKASTLHPNPYTLKV